MARIYTLVALIVLLFTSLGAALYGLENLYFTSSNFADA